MIIFFLDGLVQPATSYYGKPREDEVFFLKPSSRRTPAPPEQCRGTRWWIPTRMAYGPEAVAPTLSLSLSLVVVDDDVMNYFFMMIFDDEDDDDDDDDGGYCYYYCFYYWYYYYYNHGWRMITDDWWLSLLDRLRYLCRHEANPKKTIKTTADFNKVGVFWSIDYLTQALQQHLQPLCLPLYLYIYIYQYYNIYTSRYEYTLNIPKHLGIFNCCICSSYFQLVWTFWEY